jgi:halocyanin-like protein
MMSSGTDPNRRTLLRAAGGTVVVAALAGCAAVGQDDDNGNGDGQFVVDEPDYDDWFDDVPNYEGTLDWRGESEVVVRNGTGSDGYKYDPPAILVDVDTTVVWEWTGRGGMHTVTHTDGLFESEYLSAEEDRFEYAFDEPGTYWYYCAPHRTLDQKGAVIVE